MNIDFDSLFPFGDGDGLRRFMVTHQFVHNQIAVYSQAKLNVQFSTFGLLNPVAEDSWIDAMRSEEKGKLRAPLIDWLQLHANLHNQEYAAIAGNPDVGPPDLSIVDFADQGQFYDWMWVHMQMHDYEQSALGFT